MKKLLVFLALALPVQAQELHGRFQQWCQRVKPDQASLILVQGDRTSIEHFGGATPSTPYLVGSLTKSFTALAVALLVEQGKLSLDHPVNQLLPGLSLADSLTVRHLVCHRSGLSQAIGNRFFTGDRESVYRLLQSSAALGAPGSVFEYSNANYVLLGYVLEQVSGASYSQVIQSAILNPLGMNLTRVGLLNGRAVVTTPSFPAGGLVSPPEDLSLYLRFQLGQGRRLVSLNLLKPLVPGGEYGWGWYSDDSGDWANHSGEILNGALNYQTYTLMKPAAGKALCILAKFPRGTSSPNWCEAHVTEKFLTGGKTGSSIQQTRLAGQWVLQQSWLHLRPPDQGWTGEPAAWAEASCPIMAGPDSSTGPRGFSSAYQHDRSSRSRTRARNPTGGHSGLTSVFQEAKLAT